MQIGHTQSDLASLLRPARAATLRHASAKLSEDALAAVTRQAEAGVQIAKSMTTARNEARSAAKVRAMTTVERLREEVKLIRKLWAHDPKQMAKQLARISKELKHALADYAKAAKANGERVKSASVDVPVAQDAAKPEPSMVAPNVKPVAPAQAPPGIPPTTPPTAIPTTGVDASAASTAYTRQARDDRAREQTEAENEARGDLDFAKQVRGFVQAIRDLLQETKIRSALQASDRAGKARAFEEAEKVLNELDEDVQAMENGIKEDFPRLASGLPSTAATPSAAPAV